MEIIKENIKKIKKCATPFCINSDRQKKVCNEIKENAKGDFDFFVLIVFSGIIITLGLIVDSSAVVIGGMLLAPLFWPILSLSLAIVMGKSGLIQNSVFTLLKSTALILVIAIFIGMMSPEHMLENNEFLSRTSPTLFDLFIALSAGFVGAFIVSYPKIGAAIAGVVIAAAIVPPISVMGLSISHGNLGLAGGAFILYLAELIAVTFSASVLFIAARFKGPSSEKGLEQRKSNIRWTFVLLFVMAIPLFFITSNAIKENKQQSIIRDAAAATMPNANIININAKDKNGILIVDITIQYSGDLSKNKIDNFSNVLSRKINKVIVPRITIVPIIELWEK